MTEALGMIGHLLGLGRSSDIVIFYFARIKGNSSEPQEAAINADVMTADTTHVTTNEPAERVVEQADGAGHAAPPLSPGQPAVDFAHLARMTLGEKGLEREVLDLFERQADMLLARMVAEEPRMVGAFAH